MRGVHEGGEGGFALFAADGAGPDRAGQFHGAGEFREGLLVGARGVGFGEQGVVPALGGVLRQQFQYGQCTRFIPRHPAIPRPTSCFLPGSRT